MKIFKKLKSSISGQKDRDPKNKENNNSIPSVQDYATEKELKNAMLGKQKKKKKKYSFRSSMKKVVGSPDDPSETTSGESNATTSTVTSSVPEEEEEDHEEETMDAFWKIPNLDTATSEPQTMEEEIKRLTALQSYFILDAETSHEFDRLTEMAAKVFGVPFATIAMMDLGRQYLLTATGIPGINGMETPRQMTICCHTIKTKLPCLAVNDLTKDDRFKDNVFVSDPNGIGLRFYAGCPLIVPEGAKVGTLCIMDTKPRETPFTESEEHILQDMAALAVHALVARRQRLLKQEQDSKMLELAESYAEMHSCLCKAQSCITTAGSTIRSRSRKSVISTIDDVDSEDCSSVSSSMASLDNLAEELQLHTEISAANARTIVMEHEAQKEQFHFDNLPQDVTQQQDEQDEKELQQAKKRVPPAYVRLLQNMGGGGGEEFSVGSRSLKSNINGIAATSQGGGSGFVNMIDMYQNLNDICARFTRPVPIYLDLLGDVPAHIQCRGSDVLVFRATMSLLSNANARIHKWGATDHEDGGMIHLKIQMQDAGTSLLVECQDTGCFAAEWEGAMEFDNPRSPLHPIRKISRSLGGDCGMRLGCFAEETHGVGHDEKAGQLRAAAAKTGMELLDDVEHEQQYCIFWWSAPLVLPKEETAVAEDDEEEEREALFKVHEPTSTINGKQ